MNYDIDIYLLMLIVRRYFTYDLHSNSDTVIPTNVL